MMAATNPIPKPMLQYALEYLALGYPIFPVCSPLMGTHQHKIDGQIKDCTPDRRGKNPMRPWKDYQSRLPTETEVRSWWTRWPDANIGMATGVFSGIVALDCDNGEARQSALERGGLEKAPAVWTGKPGGIHFWLAHPGYPAKNFVREISGTDFRGDGGYILLPPSLHAKGARYRWNEHTIGAKLPPCPPWLEALLQDRGGDGGTAGSGSPLDLDAIMAGIQEGSRNNELWRYAGKLRGDDVPLAHAEALIRMAARLCKPPFEEDTAVDMVRRAYREYEPNVELPDFGLDDLDGGPLRVPGTEPTATATLAPPPVPSVWFRPISELLAMPEEEPDWMVNGLFTVASNGWVAAEPKVGKSWVVLELAYALSTGMPFLGRFAVKQPRRVLYVQEEDSLLRVLRRLKKIIKGDPMRPPPDDAFWRWSIRAGFKLDSLEWLEKLRQEIIAFNAEVVILDVFNRLHGSDENKQPEMTAILNNLTALTNAYGCAFIVVHHNRKPQSGNEARANQSMRGHSVLAGWAECSLYLKRSKEKDTIIVTPESKDAPEMEDFTVVLADQDNGGIVLEVGEVEVKEALTRGDKAVLEAVDDLAARGIGATAKAVAEVVGRDRSTTQSRLTKLAEAGYLTATAISSAATATKIYARTGAH